MAPARRAEIAAQLRRAVSCGLHAEAAALLSEYRRAVEDELRGLPLGDPAAHSIQSAALEFLQWARRTTLAARAHYARQLAALPDLRPYAPPATPPRAWDVTV